MTIGVRPRRSTRAHTDERLNQLAREGDSAAFGELYRRHVAAARSTARSMLRSPNDVEDVVAEAFTAVLSALRNGRGPKENFRGYVLACVRNGCYARRLPPIPMTDDDLEARTTPHENPEKYVEADTVARAFSSLSPRWQYTLWMTEVEQRPASEVADQLQLAPNATAALTHRARQAFASAYLSEHVGSIRSPECATVAPKLGAYVRGALGTSETNAVERHIEDCSDCRRAVAEMRDVNMSLRSLQGPVAIGGVLLAGAAGGVSGSVAGSVAPGAAGAASGTTGAGASGAAASAGTAAGAAGAASTGAAAAGAAGVASGAAAAGWFAGVGGGLLAKAAVVATLVAVPAVAYQVSRGDGSASTATPTATSVADEPATAASSLPEPSEGAAGASTAPGASASVLPAGGNANDLPAMGDQTSLGFAGLTVGALVGAASDAGFVLSAVAPPGAAPAAVPGATLPAGQPLPPGAAPDLPDLPAVPTPSISAPVVPGPGVTVSLPTGPAPTITAPGTPSVTVPTVPDPTVTVPPVTPATTPPTVTLPNGDVPLPGPVDVPPSVPFPGRGPPSTLPTVTIPASSLPTSLPVTLPPFPPLSP